MQMCYEERQLDVKKKFIEGSYQLIAKYQPCDDLKTKKLKYGLEGIYNLLLKVIVMLIITIILGIWKEYLFLTLIYAITRRYTYGLHAKKTLTCWLTTLPIYILGTLIIIHIELSSFYVILIWLLGFISFLIWAPADTPALPLIHKERRRNQKIKACLLCFVFLLVILLYPNQLFVNAICYCLLIQSICINPITYKLTNTPFDNYKIYFKKHGLNY